MTCQFAAAKSPFAVPWPISRRERSARSYLSNEAPAQTDQKPGEPQTRRCLSNVSGSGLLVMLIAAVILFTTVNGTEETVGSEYESKAGLMLTFAEFVEWPAYAFPDASAPIVLGVIGEDPFGDALEKLMAEGKAS